MKLLLALTVMLTSACQFQPRDGAEPMVTGMGRTDTSVEL
jgi:hypothetical protein